MTGYRDVSFWLSDLGDDDDLTPRPPLPGNRDVDVAVLGAGYTGLWTALELLRRDPDLRVGVVEAQVAGFGASGRNGAWCAANLGLSPRMLSRRYGVTAARRLTLELRDTVDEVGRVAAEEGIDAQFHKGGVLRIARGRHELPAVRSAYAMRVELGLDDGCTLLSRDQLDDRVHVAGAEGAFADVHGATVHPGRLVRGLATAVERRGGVVWEGTRVTRFRAGSGGRRPFLDTDHGTVTADTVVLAGEAYLPAFRALHRRLLPVYSLIVLTEPLSDRQWETVGWAGGECLSSQRITVDYLSRTRDGRILFGGRGAPYHFGSKVSPDYDRHGPTHRMLASKLQEWFPQLAGIGVTHAWGGPLAMPRDWLPSFSYDQRSGLAHAYGYTGQGVATANLAGRVLADLITGEARRWAGMPMVGHRSRRWEPEPLRWLGVRYVQLALGRLDDRAERTGRAPTGRTPAEWLARH